MSGWRGGGDVIIPQRLTLSQKPKNRSVLCHGGGVEVNRNSPEVDAIKN